MARELSSRGITCNAVAPGFIDTEMTAQMTDKAKEAVKTQIPLGRVGKVDDIAEVVTFLASEKASYITGQVISVDGGMSIWYCVGSKRKSLNLGLENGKEKL